MYSKTKKLAKRIIPPVLLDFYSKFISPYGFKGDYDGWDEAKSSAIGYDSNIILNKVKESLLKVKNGEAVYERDSVIFDKIEYSWPLLSILLSIALENDSQLKLLDFGGSLGSAYYQNIGFLKNLKSLSWNIVEQENFVKCGQEYFSDNNLHFYNNISDCFLADNIFAVLLASSLQYLENPYQVLGEILSHNPKYIIIDRLPVNSIKDLPVLQKVNPVIYKASYPAWILEESKLIRFFTDNGYELKADFDALGGDFPIKGTKFSGFYKGYFFIAKNN